MDSSVPLTPSKLVKPKMYKNSTLALSTTSKWKQSKDLVDLLTAKGVIPTPRKRPNNLESDDKTEQRGHLSTAETLKEHTTPGST